MSKQTINIGASPNDGTGTPLRTSFDYTNQNFTELYTALGGGVGLPGATTQVIFNDGGTNLAGDAGLVYNKTTDALTVGGNVQAASATITGDLTARTTGLTVNSSGVGVGTSSQSSFLGNSPKKLVVGDGTQTPALTLYGGASNVSGIYFADGTVGNEAYRGFIEYDHATDAFNLGTGGSSAITVNSSRNLAFPTGKGIDFSAVTGGTGTATANVLNDYEEGTFLPTIIGSASPGTVTYASQIGRYTKVGRVVQFQIDVSYSAGTGTGNLQIDGLPFQNSNNLAPLSTYLISIGMTALYYAVALIGTNSTKIDINQLPTGGGADATVNYDAAGRIILSGTYTV